MRDISVKRFSTLRPFHRFDAWRLIKFSCLHFSLPRTAQKMMWNMKVHHAHHWEGRNSNNCAVDINCVSKLWRSGFDCFIFGWFEHMRHWIFCASFRRSSGNIYSEKAKPQISNQFSVRFFPVFGSKSMPCLLDVVIGFWLIRLKCHCNRCFAFIWSVVEQAFNAYVWEFGKV